jgi:hypothetical protein
MVSVVVPWFTIREVKVKVEIVFTLVLFPIIDSSVKLAITESHYHPV